MGRDEERAATALDWKNPYPTVRRPTFARNVVSTSQMLGSQAGLRMLLKGGNAIDAALATAITLTITEPISNGIGSDAFLIFWDGKQLHGYNGSGRSPKQWTPKYFAGHQSMPTRGPNSVTVPGCVATWAEVSKMFGRLPFKALFEPAIEYAERGFPVSQFVSTRWQQQIEELKVQPGFEQYFMPNGRAPLPGEMFRIPDAAKTLRRIAETKGKAFYKGEIAAQIAAHSQAHGGAMTEADLAAHKGEWTTPLEMHYKGLTVHELPPNGQGIVCLIALGILAHLDVDRYPVDSADSTHLQIEAVKLAFADAYRYVSEPKTLEFDPQHLLDTEYLKSRAKLIDPKRAQVFAHGKPPKSSGTVYLTAADADGMMVSMIQSNFAGFGSGCVVPDTGVSLQNRGNGFVLTPGHPNRVGPRKRPYQTIIPGFITKNGQPLMSFGLMGGNMQPQGHTQLVVRMADYGQGPQAAIDGPRFRFVQGLEINCEVSFPQSSLEELTRRGHQIKAMPEGYFDYGCSQIIRSMGDGYAVASDARRDSLAVGF
jgi:gamma-glutamyltranspeptidase/glutathione hydrolase